MKPTRPMEIDMDTTKKKTAKTNNDQSAQIRALKLASVRVRNLVKGVVTTLEGKAHEIFEDVDRHEEWSVLVNAASDLRDAVSYPPKENT